MEWQISTRAFGANILWQFSAHPYLQTIEISNSIFTVKSMTMVVTGISVTIKHKCPTFDDEKNVQEPCVLRELLKGCYSWHFCHDKSSLRFPQNTTDWKMPCSLPHPPASSECQMRLKNHWKTWEWHGTNLYDLVRKGVIGYIEDGGQQIKSRVQFKNPWIFCPVRHLPICRFFQLF